MVRFAVGEQVTIRFGKHQGQKAKVLRIEPANVYVVKAEDGYILFYSDKGLEGQSSSPAFTEGSHMTNKKTLPLREKELQSLMSTAAGQEVLQGLDARYQAASGKSRPPKTSVITYILVHEREQGLISN